MIAPSLPPSLREAISRVLEPDEKVVWTAMPKPRCFTRSTAREFGFGLFLTVFIVLWMLDGDLSMPNHVQDWIPWVAFAFFFLIGFVLLFAPLRAYRKLLKTVYVITDRRAITMEGRLPEGVRSYWPDMLTEVFRREHKDGTGDIVLARHTTKDSEGYPHVEELGFLGIADAKSVEAKLKELAGKRGTAESSSPVS